MNPNPKHYQHRTLAMFPDRPDGSWDLRVRYCRRKWRMVYGWRNNPVKAALHFTAATTFADCALKAQKIADRLSIYRFKVVEYQTKAMFETACAFEAMCDKWVRVGTKHRWEIK